MKKTAVEWLVEQILVEHEVYYNKEGNWIAEPRIVYVNAYKEYVDLSDYVKQAKEMQDENMINFLKSVFQQDGFDYKKALEQFKK